MCVQGKHEAMEAGSSGGDGGQVGAHSLTRSKVTFSNVHTEVKENKKYITLDSMPTFILKLTPNTNMVILSVNFEL